MEVETDEEAEGSAGSAESLGFGVGRYGRRESAV